MDPVTAALIGSFVLKGGAELFGTLTGNSQNAKDRGLENEMMVQSYASKMQKLNADTALAKKFNRLDEFESNLDKGQYLMGLNQLDVDKIYSFIAKNYRG